MKTLKGFGYCILQVALRCVFLLCMLVLIIVIAILRAFSCLLRRK